MFPQLFGVLPNFHSCFYDLIEIQHSFKPISTSIFFACRFFLSWDYNKLQHNSTVHTLYLHVSNCWTGGCLAPLIADDPLQKKKKKKKQLGGPDQTTMELQNVHQYTSTHAQRRHNNPITTRPEKIWPY